MSTFSVCERQLAQLKSYHNTLLVHSAANCRYHSAADCRYPYITVCWEPERCLMAVNIHTPFWLLADDLITGTHRVVMGDEVHMPHQLDLIP